MLYRRRVSIHFSALPSERIARPLPNLNTRQMETTKNQESQPERESGVVDYASALRQYKRYGRGRSMK